MIPILLAAILAGPATLAEMRWHKRVLLVSAPRTDDPAVAAQRRALQGWDAGARERDLAIVRVIADRVDGATDTAVALRRRFHLPKGRFAVILIGKDGGEKLRSATPVAPELLADTIDAMPMRRRGQR